MLEARALVKRYPGVTALDQVDFSVGPGEVVALIGENGAGKSTLVRAALGFIDPLAGKIRMGSGVTAGYFSQDTSDLDPELSPLDMLVWDCDMLPADARNLLGRFLISGDDVYRPIKTLSGGEKNKLSLARLTRLNPNLLILDEPTNHLDMASRDALADVLQEYKGTLILVSHDRWLLGRTTTHTLDVRRGGAVEYPGSYDEYRRKQAQQKRAQTIAVKAEVVKPQATLKPHELSKEIQRLEKLVAQIEQRVEDSEVELKRIEDLLADPEGHDVFELSKDHLGSQKALADNVARWEQESQRLEELRARQG